MAGVSQNKKNNPLSCLRKANRQPQSKYSSKRAPKQLCMQAARAAFFYAYLLSKRLTNYAWYSILTFGKSRCSAVWLAHMVWD
ncbi:MAG: hypothetical protein LBC69_04070, partial [Eubacteriaceae bacterium]|nr:hypothetical protein [Eubacteriaceae bacterium]